MHCICGLCLNLSVYVCITLGVFVNELLHVGLRSCIYICMHLGKVQHTHITEEMLCLCVVFYRRCSVDFL